MCVNLAVLLALCTKTGLKVHSIQPTERASDVEVPLVALLGLVDLWIALATFILGGAQRRNYAGVHDTDFTQYQTVLLQVESTVAFFKMSFASFKR